MPRPSKLTPAEWEIMEAVWELGEPASVRDVLERAFPRGEKAYTTVQTVMNTLEKKSFLERKKVGLVNFYSPTRSREDAVRTEMRTLMARVFGGSVPAFANSLFSLDDLELGEIDEIKQLLRRKEHELTRSREAASNEGKKDGSP